MYWSDIFIKLSNTTLYYILYSVVAVGLSWALVKFIFLNKRCVLKKNGYLIVFSPKIKNKIFFITCLWCVLSAVELLYHRDLPLLTAFGLGSILYHEYGIPSLHGFLNALILSLSMYMLYSFIESKNKKYLFLYIFTIVPFILMMTRGGITSLLLQSLFVLLIFKEVKFNLILKILFLSIFFIFLFSFLGKFRYGNFSNDFFQVFQISSNYPDFMPLDFMWVYMYITSSINNLEYNISLYNNWNFEPYILVFDLLPSVIRQNLPTPYSTNLVNSAFNVSSFMPKYLSAFGLHGSLIFYFFAALFPLIIYQKFLLQRKLKHGFILAILLHSIVLSIFSDFFLIITYVFQILIQYFVFSTWTYQKKK